MITQHPIHSIGTKFVLHIAIVITFIMLGSGIVTVYYQQQTATQFLEAK
jgi:hypothetical protein